MRRQLRAAICRINVMPDGPDAKSLSRGTGFLVAPDLILTALHVVADRRTEPPTPYPGAIQLDFPDQPTTAVIHAPYWDCKDDWVLLRCPTPLPIAPLALSTPQESSIDWLTFGFPDANPRDGMVQTGSVENFDGTLDDAPVYQLLSRQAAAGRGAPSRGLSGGPVIVGQQVIGLLRFALMKEGETVAGTLYGCPVARAVERCPALLQLQPPETPSTLDALEIKWRRHRRALIGAVTALTLVTIALATKVTRDAWKLALIAAMPFEVDADDPAAAQMKDLHVQVARVLESANIPIMSPNAVTHFIEGKRAKFGELAQRDVIGVVEGSVLRKDGRYKVSLTFTQPANILSKGDVFLDWDADRLHELPGEIADRTISKLKIPVSSERLAQIKSLPTARSDAYFSFHRASAFLDNVQMDGSETLLLRSMNGQPVDMTPIEPDEWSEPEQELLNAIAIDAKFAAAWARLAQTYAMQLKSRGTRVTLTDAETALAEATKLNPRLADVHVARGHLLYRRDGDYRGALREYLAALKLSPTNSRLLAIVGLAQRRVGETAAAIENLKTAVKLHPDSWPLLTTLATIMRQERRFVEARAFSGRAMLIAKAAPVTPPQVAVEHANLQIADRGEVGYVSYILESILVFERQSSSLRSFDGSPPGNNPVPAPDILPHLIRSPFLFNFIDSHLRDRLVHYTDPKKLRTIPGSLDYCFRDSSPDLKTRLAEKMRSLPRGDSDSNQATGRPWDEALTIIPHLRGEPGYALSPLDEGAQVARKNSDAIGQMHIEDARLTVHMHLKDTAKVLELIASTLKRPSNYSAAWLRKDPLFAPLHANPEFIRLTAP